MLDDQIPVEEILHEKNAVDNRPTITQCQL